jgi:hypothetical protein
MPELLVEAGRSLETQAPAYIGEAKGSSLRATVQLEEKM